MKDHAMDTHRDLDIRLPDEAIAPVGRRMTATALDVVTWVIVWVLYDLVWWSIYWRIWPAAIRMSWETAPELPFLLVIGAYSVFMESAPWQGTLGKILLKIKVADTDGKRISRLRALGRFIGKLLAALGVISCCGGITSLLCQSVSRYGQGIQDLVSGTLVLHDAGPPLQPPTIPRIEPAAITPPHPDGIATRGGVREG